MVQHLLVFTCDAKQLTMKDRYLHIFYVSVTILHLFGVVLCLFVVVLHLYDHFASLLDHFCGRFASRIDFPTRNVNSQLKQRLWPHGPLGLCTVGLFSNPSLVWHLSLYCIYEQ